MLTSNPTKAAADSVPLYVVLGKRLRNNELTPEGQARVDCLIQALQARPAHLPRPWLVFCGGRTHGQSQSEAAAMLAYFQTQAPQAADGLAQLLLEDRSTTTVENFAELAKLLSQTQLPKQGLRLCLVSSHQHLHRVFEIQQLMDEQGLLRKLRQVAEQAQLPLLVPHDPSQHLSAPYCHQGLQAELYLRIDELTTYRVFLEGWLAGVFARPLAQVRQQPLALGLSCLDKLQALCQNQEQWQLLPPIFNTLTLLLQQTDPSCPLAQVRKQLSLLNFLLTWLADHLDPEASSQ